MARKIKGGNAKVECVGDEVIVTGNMVNVPPGAAASFLRVDGTAKLTVGTTEPTSPAANDLWIDTDN